MTRPSNRRDLARFLALDDARQAEVTRRAHELYDGSRTVAACWKLALSEAEA